MTEYIKEDLFLEQMHRKHKISDVVCDFYTEGCIVALERNGHISKNVYLSVDGITEKKYRLIWDKKVNTNGWQEDKVIAEFGGYCMAFLLVSELTEFTVLRQAKTRTGVDFYIGYNEKSRLSDQENFFKDLVRMEVSGILKENGSNTVQKRYKKKLDQTRQSDHQKIPVFIAITEFGSPKSKFLMK